MEESKGIYKAMASIMNDVSAVGKDNRNDMQKYNFRSIDAVYNAIHPILAKNCVFMSPHVLEEKSEERITQKGGLLIYRILKIKYFFYHADGSSIDVTVIGEGMDSGDKASNKAMSAAHKYALFQCFCIPTEEKKDADYETPPELLPKTTTNFEFLASMKKIKEEIGDEKYYKILKDYGFEKSNQIVVRKQQGIVYKEMINISKILKDAARISGKVVDDAFRKSQFLVEKDDDEKFTDKPANGDRITNDELADIYDKHHRGGIKARTIPIEKVYDWAESRKDLFSIDPKTSQILLIKTCPECDSIIENGECKNANCQQGANRHT